MLIGIDASRANRQHRSGTEWYSYYLIKELAKLDSQNEYILYTDEPLRPDLTNLSVECEETQAVSADSLGYQLVCSPHNNFRAKVLTWPFAFLWTQGRLSLEMLRQPPDILFVPGHTLPIIHPKRSVVTIHDLAFERDRSIYLKQKMGPASKPWRRLLNLAVLLLTRGRFGANTMDYLSWSTLYGLKKASRVITVSEFSHQEILELYQNLLPPSVFKKIRVVLNGFNDQLFCQTVKKEQRPQVLARYGIKRPYLFYLGRIERKKNIHNLIEAFGLAKRELPHMNLVLTGDASYGSDEVDYLISEYGLDDSVVKTGWVNEEDLPYIFSGAQAFVFPSLYEGFGIPLLEAMACGVPVTCSTAPGVVEVVGDAALLFAADNKQLMAEALIKVSYNETLRAGLKEAGFRRASQFSWEKTAKETLRVLLESD